MKGYFSIQIPTKSYIKAYIIAELGDNPVMRTDHRIGSRLYDLVSHTNERRTEFSNVRYNTLLKLYVSFHTFRQRGIILNETNIKNLNLFIEDEIKSRYRYMMDFYMKIFPNFKANDEFVRKQLGIDYDSWDYDSLKKDYYRYRKKNGGVLLHKRILVPSQHIDPAF
ncbi:MAG TPA: hypothetical protein VG847_13950 [Chitinophagaceae bacterium]|nr:hypothetical protein [Chitinophagaceae bacterium]